MVAFFGLIFLFLVSGIIIYIIKEKISPETLALDEERLDNLKHVGKDLRIASKDQISKFYSSVNGNSKNTIEMK